MHKILSQPLTRRSFTGGTLYEFILCDISYSMDEESFERRKSKRKLMTHRGLDWLSIKVANRPQDFVTVVAFHDDAFECCDLLSVGDAHQEIRSAIRRVAEIKPGGTYMCVGLDMILRRIKQLQMNAEVNHALESGELALRCIAYSDGHDGGAKRGIRIASELKDRGVLIETLGVARKPKEVDEKFLRKVATTDDEGCHYRFIGDTESLDQTFKQLATGMLTVDD